MLHVRSGLTSWKVTGFPEIEFLLDRDPSNYSYHIHEGFNIDYLQSGVLEYRIGVRNFLVRPGNFVWINPFAVHRARPLCKYVSIKSLFLSESYIQDIVSDIKTVELNIEPIVRDTRMGGQIEAIHNLSRVSNSALEIETRLVEFLSAFLLTPAEAVPSALISNEHEAVKTIQEYLLTHYAENISLGRLANLVQLNRTYLVRVFKERVGLPPYSYLTQIRVAKARNLLLSDMPLAEVADAVGFSDQSHFSRFFKRATGRTPGSFRFTNKSQGGKALLPLW